MSVSRHFASPPPQARRQPPNPPSSPTTPEPPKLADNPQTPQARRQPPQPLNLADNPARRNLEKGRFCLSLRPRGRGTPRAGFVEKFCVEMTRERFRGNDP